MKEIKTEDLLKELESRGFKRGYVYGHGESEPAGQGDFIIADLEKTSVLISPEDLFDEPVPYDKWF